MNKLYFSLSLVLSVSLFIVLGVLLFRFFLPCGKSARSILRRVWLGPDLVADNSPFDSV